MTTPDRFRIKNKSSLFESFLDQSIKENMLFTANSFLTIDVGTTVESVHEKKFTTIDVFIGDVGSFPVLNNINSSTAIEYANKLFLDVTTSTFYVTKSVEYVGATNTTYKWEYAKLNPKFESDSIFLEDTEFNLTSLLDDIYYKVLSYTSYEKSYFQSTIVLNENFDTEVDGWALNKNFKPTTDKLGDFNSWINNTADAYYEAPQAGYYSLNVSVLLKLETAYYDIAIGKYTDTTGTYTKAFTAITEGQLNSASAELSSSFNLSTTVYLEAGERVLVAIRRADGVSIDYYGIMEFYGYHIFENQPTEVATTLAAIDDNTATLYDIDTGVQVSKEVV